MDDSDLRRPQNVSGGMQRDGDAVQCDLLTIGQAADSGSGLHPGPQHSEARLRSEIGSRAPAGVIPMGMGDHCTVDWLPGVAVEVAWLAVETTRGNGEQGHAEE